MNKSDVITKMQPITSMDSMFIPITQRAYYNRKLLGSFCDEWLLLSRNRIKESSYAKYHNMITLHIKPLLGDVLPQQLDTVMVEDFSNQLLRDLSPKSVRDTLTLLRSILKYCHRQIGEPFPDIDIIYPKDPKKEMRILTRDEQELFIRCLLSDMTSIRFGILLALMTGMRIGEICALRWSDISIKNQVIHVHRTIQRIQNVNKEDIHKTKILIGSAKSDSSDRIIPLTAYTLSLCERMYCADGEAYVLTGCRVPMEPRALQYQLGKVTKECHLEGVHFHTLRHTFATRCVEVGFEIKSLSEILGHSSSKITLDRYVHPSLELKRMNMEKLAVVGW